MDKEFFDRVTKAADLVRKRNLSALGECGLDQQLRNLLQKRLRPQTSPLSAREVGAILADLTKDTIGSLKPSGDENLNEVDWRHYIVLHCYIVLGWEWGKVTERLGVGRSRFFELRKAAVESLAFAFWCLEQDAVIQPDLVRHNLPHRQYLHFITRFDDESRDHVEWIIEQLSVERAWIVAIDGGPGVGKTTIAREVAQRCLERELFEAIIWTSAQCRTFYPPTTVVRATDYVISLDTILDTVGKTIGKRDIGEMPSLEEKVRALRSTLSVTNCLLIIDNLESLGREAQEQIFGFLLRDLPRPNKAIVTGRERDYPGQLRITVPVMELDEAFPFMHSEARSRGVQPLSKADTQRIYEATQGIPLAMQQAIGLVQVLGYSVEEATAFGEIQEKMLEFMYEEAYRKLRDEEKKMLHVMPIFAEPALRDAIGVASSSWGSHLTVGLGRLYRAFLVQKVDYDRCEILPLTREFLDAILERDGILIGGVPLADFLTSARRSLSRYYIASLGDMNLAERLLFLRHEKRNILQLMEWCHVAQEHQLLVDLVQVMGWPLSIHGDWKDRITWALRAIEASEAIDRPDLKEWFRVHDLAWSYVRTRRVQKGERIIKEALQSAQTNGYRRVEALALRNLGRLTGERGGAEKGIEFLKTSLVLWDDLGDREWLARTVGALGKLRYEQGDWLGAERSLEEALKLHREIGYLDGEISTLSELALVKTEQGDVEKALELSEQALALARGIEKPAPPYAYALWLRAQLEEKLGESPEKRCQRIEEAVKTYENAGARHWANQARKWLEKH